MAAKILKPNPTSSKDASVTTTADTYPSRRRVVENFLLIWVDGNINESNKNCRSQLTQLRSIVNDVNLFTQSDEGIKFLKNIGDDKAFVIVSGSLGQSLVSDIHRMPQLDAVYIFCSNKSRHEQWVKEWGKVKGVHTEIQFICDALRVATKQCNQDAITVSFVTIDEEGSDRNLDQLDPTFMYTQILKEILLGLDYGVKSVSDLVLYCRNIYAGNYTELHTINEFKHEYNPRSSIWWYTRECFMYQMLHRALRTLEVDTIITIGFFICDLHRQIEELHQEQVSNYRGKPFIVYRGQGLLETDFDKLQKTKGGLMSFNNFLSTNKNRDLSLNFAKGALAKSNMFGILFHMTIDPSISSTPFAMIDEVSYFKTEGEVLFSLQTVFRIGRIKRMENNDRLHQVELTLTGDEDLQLRPLTKYIQHETRGSGWHRLGRLLLKIGQYNKAKVLYKELLEQTSDEGEKALYYNQLGLVNDNQEDYEKAIRYYEKALEIYQKARPSNHPSLTTSYNNIGLVHTNMGEYKKALSFHEKALKTKAKILSPNHPSLAASYNNIAAVYYQMKEYSNALSSYEKALEIKENTLPSNSLSLAISLNCIGWVYRNMGNYSQALVFYERALEIRQRSLPPNHYSIQDVKNSIETIRKIL